MSEIHVNAEIAVETRVKVPVIQPRCATTPTPKSARAPARAPTTKTAATSAWRRRSRPTFPPELARGVGEILRHRTHVTQQRRGDHERHPDPHERERHAVLVVGAHSRHETP